MNLKNYSIQAFLIGCLTLSIFGCNPKKAMEDKMGEVIGEKILESAGMESENLAKAGKQKNTISINYDGSELASSENGIASIQVTKNMTAMTFGDTGKGFNALIGLSMNPEKLKSIPLGIEYIKGSNPDKKDTFTFTLIMKGGMYVINEGVITIEEFSKTRFAMSINGKGGPNTADTHNGVDLKDFKVEITSENPVYLFMGVKKEEIL
jgi:hypothetical protein